MWLSQATSPCSLLVGIRYDYRSTRPLTPALSPWERGPVYPDATAAVQAIAGAVNDAMRAAWLAGIDPSPQPSPRGRGSQYLLMPQLLRERSFAAVSHSMRAACLLDPPPRPSPLPVGEGASIC